MTPNNCSYLLVFFYLIAHLQLFSQNRDWQLFPQNGKNLYRLDSVASGRNQQHRYLVYPIGVDSVLSDSNSQTHFLNHKMPFTNVKGDVAWFYDQYRTVLDSTNGYVFSPEGSVILDFFKVHPTYYKSIHYRNDDKAIVIDNHYLFFPNSKVGDQWTNVLANNDTLRFSCISAGIDKLSPFANQTDSIKVFRCQSLLGTVEIKLSKNFGLIQWYPYLLAMTDRMNYRQFVAEHWDTKERHLVPLTWLGNQSANQAIGYQLPRSNDFEKLPQVGDIRVWRKRDGDFYGHGVRGIHFDSVTKIEQRPNGYFIHYHTIQKNFYKEFGVDTFRYTFSESSKIVSFPTIWMRIIDAYPLVGYVVPNRSEYDEISYTPYFYASYLNNKWNTRVEMNYFYFGFQADSTINFEAGYPCHAYYTTKLNTSLGFYNVDEEHMSGGMDSTLIGRRTGGLNPATMTTWGKLYPFNTDRITSRLPSEMATNSSVLIYPNPTQEFIYIQHPYPNRVTYQIYDSIGKILQSGEASNDEAISLAQLPSGNYLIQICYQDAVSGYRLVKY